MERDSSSSSDIHVSASRHRNTGKKPSSDYRHDHASTTRPLSVRDLTRLLLHEEQSSSSLARLLSVTESELATERQHARTLQAQLEQFVHHFKATNDRRMKAEEEALLACEELKLWKVQLSLAQKEIERAQGVVNSLEGRLRESQDEARKAKAVARRMTEDRLIREAREEGRREGMREGLEVGFEEGRRRGLQRGKELMERSLEQQQQREERREREVQTLSSSTATALVRQARTSSRYHLVDEDLGQILNLPQRPVPASQASSHSTPSPSTSSPSATATPVALSPVPEYPSPLSPQAHAGPPSLGRWHESSTTNPTTVVIPAHIPDPAPTIPAPDPTPVLPAAETQASPTPHRRRQSSASSQATTLSQLDIDIVTHPPPGSPSRLSIIPEGNSPSPSPSPVPSRSGTATPNYQHIYGVHTPSTFEPPPMLVPPATMQPVPRSTTPPSVQSPSLEPVRIQHLHADIIPQPMVRPSTPLSRGADQAVIQPPTPSSRRQSQPQLQPKQHSLPPDSMSGQVAYAHQPSLSSDSDSTTSDDWNGGRRDMRGDWTTGDGRALAASYDGGSNSDIEITVETPSHPTSSIIENASSPSSSTRNQQRGDFLSPSDAERPMPMPRQQSHSPPTTMGYLGLGGPSTRYGSIPQPISAPGPASAPSSNPPIVLSSGNELPWDFTPTGPPIPLPSQGGSARMSPAVSGAGPSLVRTGTRRQGNNTAISSDSSSDSLSTLTTPPPSHMRPVLANSPNVDHSVAPLPPTSVYPPSPGHGANTPSINRSSTNSGVRLGVPISMRPHSTVAETLITPPPPVRLLSSSPLLGLSTPEGTGGDTWASPIHDSQPRSRYGTSPVPQTREGPDLGQQASPSLRGNGRTSHSGFEVDWPSASPQIDRIHQDVRPSPSLRSGPGPVPSPRVASSPLIYPSTPSGDRPEGIGISATSFLPTNSPNMGIGDLTNPPVPPDLDISVVNGSGSGGASGVSGRGRGGKRGKGRKR